MRGLICYNLAEENEESDILHSLTVWFCDSGLEIL